MRGEEVQELCFEKTLGNGVEEAEKYAESSLPLPQYLADFSTQSLAREPGAGAWRGSLAREPGAGAWRGSLAPEPGSGARHRCQTPRSRRMSWTIRSGGCDP